MQELGFIMDKNGLISYFGEWTKLDRVDKKNRNLGHTTSFEDDIENTAYFRSLHLLYDRIGDFWLHKEALDFSLQGIAIGLNVGTIKNTEAIKLYAPKDITDLQKESFTKLYDVLSTFDTVEIKPVKTMFVKKDFIYTCVEDFYEDYGIDIPYRKIK